jgi:hypothetical protein
MNDRLKAIETYYAGYRFRSRLEARWAVFLEACGLKFDYEPEGFDLDGIRYLPDFWVHPQFTADVPDIPAVLGFWLEVKGPPVAEGDEAWRKAEALTAISGAPVALFSGQIRFPLHGWLFTPWNGNRGTGSPEKVGWMRCPECGLYWVVHGLDDMLCFCLTKRASRGRVEQAVYRAMQARFEHGERGR